MRSHRFPRGVENPSLLLSVTGTPEFFIYLLNLRKRQAGRLAAAPGLRNIFHQPFNRFGMTACGSLRRLVHNIVVNLAKVSSSQTNGPGSCRSEEHTSELQSRGH